MMVYSFSFAFFFLFKPNAHNQWVHLKISRGQWHLAELNFVLVQSLFAGLATLDLSYYSNSEVSHRVAVHGQYCCCRPLLALSVCNMVGTVLQTTAFGTTGSCPGKFAVSATYLQKKEREFFTYDRHHVCCLHLTEYGQHLHDCPSNYGNWKTASKHEHHENTKNVMPVGLPHNACQPVVANVCPCSICKTTALKGSNLYVSNTFHEDWMFLYWNSDCDKSGLINTSRCA